MEILGGGQAENKTKSRMKMKIKKNTQGQESKNWQKTKESVNLLEIQLLCRIRKSVIRLRYYNSTTESSPPNSFGQ